MNGLASVSGKRVLVHVPTELLLALAAIPAATPTAGPAPQVEDLFERLETEMVADVVAQAATARREADELVWQELRGSEGLEAAQGWSLVRALGARFAAVRAAELAAAGTDLRPGAGQDAMALLGMQEEREPVRLSTTALLLVALQQDLLGALRELEQ